MTKLDVCGDWEIQVHGTAATRLAVKPPPIVTVTAEACPSLPVFDPQAPGWRKGYRIKGVETDETTAKGMLFADTVRVRLAHPTAQPAPARLGGSLALPKDNELIRGKDFDFDSDWGTLGRLVGGQIAEGQPVTLSYQHALSRLDSVVQGADGRVTIREGAPHVAMPTPPALRLGEVRLANIWVPGRLAKLSGDNLFPILETEYPEPRQPDPVPAAKLLPRAYAKLTSGKKLKILAWGDSVTFGGYLDHPETEHWQQQFVARLREQFPKATIELVSHAWDGHTTLCYLNDPPGAAHNYAEQILAVRPDLVVSEFVNDAGLPVPETMARYATILADFRRLGAEWIILTPHYIMPEWMHGIRQREIDNDPREYVRAVREFGAREGVAVADAAKRWGRLWRQGLPYMTLMSNAINHPNPAGLKLFADALMELF